ncbi:MAG: S9 family peptidase [Candidatus Bathyarchaeia archaeon]
MKKLGEYPVMPLVPMSPVGDTRVSPDGTSVIFTYSEVNMDDDKYDIQIWMMDLREERPRQFTYSTENSTSPRWSPDGKMIAFTSNRPSKEDTKEEEKKEKKKAQLFVIPAAGGEARQVTQAEEGIQSPEWSPDNKTIMFLSPVFKGEKANEDSDVKVIRRMKYKHDGKGFSVGKYVHLFVVTEDGETRQLTDGLYDVEAAAWSPDGERIAFIANMEEDADKSFFRDIYTVPVEGGEPELLLKGFGRLQTLKWSPCGKYIAFIGREIEDPSLVWHKNSELYVIPSEGGEPRCLTEDFDRTVARTEPIWSPDSKQVYVTFPNNGSSHIYGVSMEGEVEAITEGNFTVNSFTLDDSGRVFAFNASSHVKPAELYIRDEDSQREVTDMNSGILEELRISEPEEFWFTASDGVDVQGWIVKPHDCEEGERYPTLIEIHGGPRSAYGFKFDSAEHEFQVLADNGYVVVYTNPRASIGYGEQFAGLISGHWGERDYKDVMEATDYVIENYDYIDPDRVGVLGGSYGGFMTNWIIGHTNRYKAAVTQRSISNWYSFHGTSDIGWMTLPTHELINGKDPWEDHELCMEKSSITYVENMETPLLIIHSENDYRCPIEQGEQLYIALKKLDKTVEFVRFPDEPHGLSRTGKPKHRLERLQHIIRWFDRHL